MFFGLCISKITKILRIMSQEITDSLDQYFDRTKLLSELRVVTIFKVLNYFKMVKRVLILLFIKASINKIQIFNSSKTFSIFSNFLELLS